MSHLYRFIGGPLNLNSDRYILRKIELDLGLEEVTEESHRVAPSVCAVAPLLQAKGDMR